MPSMEQRYSPLLLVASCGAVVMGTWYVASGITPFTNAYTKVQPKLDTQVGMFASGSQPRLPAHQPVSQHPSSNAVSLNAAKVPPPAVLEAAGVSSAFAPWLSLAAIIVSAVAIVVNCIRQPQPAAVAAEPVYMYRPSEESNVIPQRSNQMDQVAIATKQELASRKNISPKQVVLDLQRGNARFWSGTPIRPELNAMERRAAIIGQAPTVCILSCADSRVPVEILFDQGLGNVFVVRVAGNILDATAMGSIEFSVKYLGVKVLMVMGHEACGAVKGAMTMTNADLDAQPAYLQSVLRSIKSNLNVAQLSKIRDNRAQDREAVVMNTSSQVKRLQENKLIAERVANGSLLVCGAFYEITSGIVDFFTLDKNGLVIDV